MIIELIILIILIKMGILVSQQQRRASQNARQIRLDLYNRVNKFQYENQRNWDQIRQDKKQMIISSSASNLCKIMNQGLVTAQEVILTFIERTIQIGIKNNYVIDEMFEEAVRQARDIDMIRKNNQINKNNPKKDSYPPFYGVPISIKQSILMKNRISWLGFSTGRVNQKQQSSIMVMVKKMGFIPFVRTSVPQACHSFQTNNNILGYCKNPWDETRSCGGSSGGQGGLVGSFCSPFGLANDLFCDTKVPCQFNGCLTLKPYLRYTNRGNAYSSKFVQGLPFHDQFCPIVHHVEDLITWNEYLCNQENYQDIPRHLQDSYLKHLTFKSDVLNSKQPKRIGFLIDFACNIKCSPAHSRAIHETIKILQKQCHDVCQIRFEKAQQLNSLLFRLLYAHEKLSVINQNRKGQRLIKQFKKFVLFSKLPYFFIYILSKILKRFMPKLSHQLSLLGSFKMKSYYQIFHQINVIKKAFYKYLQSQRIDAIIAPGFFMPANQLGSSSSFTYYHTFNHAWNLLNYPVGCLPITTVRADQQYYKDYQMNLLAKRANKNMEKSQGIPVGIQIISYPGNEQLILNLMKTIQNHVKFNKKFKNQYSPNN